MKVKVILTGVTGMVGEGVLLECLVNPAVEKILVVGRKVCGYSHPKLEEVIADDFMKLSEAADRFRGYDSCFFCAGTSSVRTKEEDYSRFTYDITTNLAKVFIEQNPDSRLSFCYVSGYGTDSTERGKIMWARVKGKTENRLIEMFAKNAYMFRPGYIRPTKGQKNVLSFYFGWQLFYPVMKFLAPGFTCTLEEVGRAMINCALEGYPENILETRDIIRAAK